MRNSPGVVGRPGRHMNKLLLPLSWLYGAAMACRNKAFDLGLLNSEDVGVPVISVGNMTMGGVGKTPLVEYIVGMCLAKARKVAVVSRGYRRSSQGVVMVSDGRKLLADAGRGGDEPVQMARKHPHTIVVVGERRVEAARAAVSGLKADLIVMDDGFQHRSIRRELDIVVIDSRKDLFLTPMIPAGERRESLRALGRAQLVALSRSDQDTGWWKEKGEASGIPTIRYCYRIERLREVCPDGERDVDSLDGKNLFLFSGIGDHRDFLRQVKEVYRPVVGELRFPDHHAYSSGDLNSIAAAAKAAGATALLTTEKDAVRLSGNREGIKTILQQFPLFYVGIAIDITQGKEVLHSMIEECLLRGSLS